jgi:hypothetical protein
MTLRVEVTCPEDTLYPEKTISRQAVMKSLIRVGANGGGYAVVDPDNPRALTANMKIVSAEFDPCPCCGSTN